MQPRSFTLRTLFLSVTLSAIGLACLRLSFVLFKAVFKEAASDLAFIAIVPCYFGGGAALGSSLGILFDQKLYGAILGIVAACLFACAGFPGAGL